MSVSLLTRALLLALGLGAALTVQAQPANAKPPLDSRSGPTPTAAAAEEAAARARRIPGDHIAVVVNSDVVAASEIASRVERARAAARASGERVSEDELRKAAQEALIEDRVLVTHARDAGARVEEPELDRVVANIAAQNKISLAQLQERLKADGIDLKRFRENLRDQMLTERVRDAEVMRRIRVTDGEIDKFLEDKRAGAAARAPINLAQILIPFGDGASDEQKAARRAEAEAALKRVQAGEDFASVARELSQDSNRRNGGEIGLRPADKLPELFVQAVSGVKSGELVPFLVESGVGFHVLKVVERQEQVDTGKVTETRARHILIRPNERVPAPQAGQRLAEIKRAIEAGRVKFEDIAKSVSEDGTAQQGGDLGWASPGNFVPEFEEAMNALPLGGISDPFQSRFGLHIVQVLERREVAVEPRQIREQARAQIRERKFEEAYKEWIGDLRSKAFVEVREAPTP